MYGINLSHPISSFSRGPNMIVEVGREGLINKFLALEQRLIVKSEFAESAEVKAILEKVIENLHDKTLLDNALTDKTDADAFANELIDLIQGAAEDESHLCSLLDDMDAYLVASNDQSPAQNKDSQLRQSAILQKLGMINEKLKALEEKCPAAAPSSWKRTLLRFMGGVLLTVVATIFSKPLGLLVAKSLGLLAIFLNLKYQIDDAVQNYKTGVYKPSKTLLVNVQGELNSIKAKVELLERRKDEEVVSNLQEGSKAVQEASQANKKQIEESGEAVKVLQGKNIAFEKTVKKGEEQIAQLIEKVEVAEKALKISEDARKAFEEESKAVLRMLKENLEQGIAQKIAQEKELSSRNAQREVEYQQKINQLESDKVELIQCATNYKQMLDRLMIVLQEGKLLKDLQDKSVGMSAELAVAQ